MSQTKPITLHGGVVGPNPFSVAVVLEELGLDYDVVMIDTYKGEHKQPAYTKINPNGRVPALVDHSNGDFAIWYSDAILLYLVDKYDTEHKLSVADPNERYSLIQWLFYQASGQGPYFGQAMWFLNYHGEKIPSAIERYQKEILRVLGVLESVLSKQEWLVGGKLTIADLSFVPWNEGAIHLALKGVEGGDVEKEFPSVFKWHQKLIARPIVAKFLAIQAEFMKARQASQSMKG
ncbi:glutathione S-transferase C-terminal-like protein [Lenzites betulinus]|nr:glutathione S-transferase C-terminal-like protein [Lenzites betulinus]